MATRYACTLGLPLLMLTFFASVPAIAELRPVKEWHCTTAAPDAQSRAEDPRGRTITLYEYRSPENCLDDALPPAGTFVCRADYTKDGVTETLWRARNNRDYCQPRAEALVQDLDTAGFSCETRGIAGCEEQTDVTGDPEPERDAKPLPAVEPARKVEPRHEAEVLKATEPPASTIETKTPTTSVIRNTAPIDKTASRNKQLLVFFNGLFDPSLASAMTGAAIPDNFGVHDENTLSAGNGESLRFTRGTHAWETRRDQGVLVINADFQRGTSFNDVFFGFTFDRSNSTSQSDRHQFSYLGIVSPETSSEVIYAGKDKIIISSKWYAESTECYSSLTTDEYQWSDSIYGTQRVQRISTDDNPDCAER